MNVRSATLAVGILGVIAVLSWLAWSVFPSRGTPVQGLGSAEVRTQPRPAANPVLEAPPQEPPQASPQRVPEPKPVASEREAVLESPADVLARRRARMLSLAETGQWDKSFGQMSSDQMKAERKRVEKQIFDETHDWFESQFAAGNARPVSPGPDSITDFDNFDIHWIRYPVDGSASMVTLPESDFKKVYEEKALSAWLFEHIK